MLCALLIAAALFGAQTPEPASQDRPPTPEEMDALQQLYDSSCGSRGYAQYDDVCILITKQIEDAKKAAAKKLKDQGKAKPTPKPAPPPKSPDPADAKADSPKT